MGLYIQREGTRFCEILYYRNKKPNSNKVNRSVATEVNKRITVDNKIKSNAKERKSYRFQEWGFILLQLREKLPYRNASAGKYVYSYAKTV